LLVLGHGKLTELSDEKDFFESNKRSPKLVCHFYDQKTEKYEAVQKALENLAAANFFTRFCQIKAERVSDTQPILIYINLVPILSGTIAIEKYSGYWNRGKRED
jgi:hypothetical protein